jgi:hypothetical protein
MLLSSPCTKASHAVLLPLFASRSHPADQLPADPIVSVFVIVSARQLAADGGWSTAAMHSCCVQLLIKCMAAS